MMAEPVVAEYGLPTLPSLPCDPAAEQKKPRRDQPIEAPSGRAPLEPFSTENPSQLITSANHIVHARAPRKSIFKELDVDGLSDIEMLRDRKPSGTYQPSQNEELTSPIETANPPRGLSSSNRLWMLALIVVVAIPLLYDSPLLGNAGPSILGATAGVIRYPDVEKPAAIEGGILKRDNSPTDVCSRWSHQAAVVNGTIYVYGGRATNTSGQKSNTWTNAFLSLDLTKDWQISSPPAKGLPQPSGPPPVSNGQLWNSYNTLFLYGGEFQDTPALPPIPYSMWQYDIPSSSWTQRSNPKTSSGNNSDGGNQPVQEAAEGAGISVPQLGRGWYFGGHLDDHTTAGWSNQIDRVYLKSIIEYTFPGYSNDGVQSLSGGKTAGQDGVWRNITQGGIQDSNAFPSRADGVLTYIPGYGAHGILLSLAGGTNESFVSYSTETKSYVAANAIPMQTQMNVIDVYDIATSTWYKQATSGAYPLLRVNPCAVAASAPDGSSTNVYLYGGQNLIPAENQTQYGDMWILTIPSFTWIEVNTTGQSVPPPRVGHSCSIWDGQIVVVGGYTGPDLSCDSGFYVFSASNLTWQNSFASLGGPSGPGGPGGGSGSGGGGGGGGSNNGGGSSSGGSNSAASNGGSAPNPQNQQLSQLNDSSALSGSYGYQVPAAVQAVIGGHALGGATITAPAQSATAGPLATGKPITYTVTDANGATVTETGTSGVSGSNNNGSHGPNIAAIVAGVVAGCFAVLAGYLGFCAWVYRRQLTLYKNHVAMSQRAAAGGLGGPGEKAAFLGADGLAKTSTDQSSHVGGASSKAGTGTTGTSGFSSVPPLPGALQPPMGGNSTTNSSSEDLMSGAEPTFVGVLLNPRRSLRVINRD